MRTGPDQNTTVHERISQFAAKWYMPIAADIIRLCELHPLDTETDALDAIQRSDKPAIAFPTLVAPKSVLGRNPLDLKALFFAPLVVRLHYVAQLSTTYLRGNADAKHCRLSHALGSLSVLSVLMERVTQQLKGDPDAEKCLPNDYETIAAFTYAAIHDTFQGPFGHVLDALRVDLVGADRRLDKTLLYYMFSQALAFHRRENIDPPKAVAALYDILEATVAKPLGVPLQFILEWIAEASDQADRVLTVERSVRRSQLKWLYELLEGPLDADRWDYLWRDTLHLGLKKNNGLIFSLFFRFVSDLTVCWYRSESRLLVTQEMADDLARDFFGLRRNLYRQVYENPEKRLIDSMLIRTIYLGLLDPRTRESDGSWQSMSTNFQIDLMNITDAELLSALETVTHPLAAHLARELRTFPVMRIVWRYPIGDDIFPLALRQEGIIKDFHYNGSAPPRWAEQAEELADVLKVNYEKLRAIKSKGEVAYLDTSAQVYPLSALLHCSVFSTRASRLLHLERVVWRMVRRELDISTYEGIAASVSARLALPSIDVGGLLQQCPPIFISFPWLSLSSSDAVREIAREPGERTLCVKEGDEVVEKSPGMLMSGVVGANYEPAYTIVAGYPLFFVSRLSDKDRLALDKQIEAAIEKLIRSGCCLALPNEYLKEEHEREIARFVSQIVLDDRMRVVGRR